MICCNAKHPQSRAELWHVHLIPAKGATMFAFKSIGRKRYARVVNLSEKSEASQEGEEQIQVDSTSPWGYETLFQFKYFEGGRYSLLTSSCKYLTSEGMCIDIKSIQNNASGAKSITNQSKTLSTLLPPNECFFTIEYHGGHIAFRDNQGRYLAATGRASILRSRANNVSKDELFQFECAPIQISLRATFNNKWVSIKQGKYDLLTSSKIKFTSIQLTLGVVFSLFQTKGWTFQQIKMRLHLNLKPFNCSIV